MSFFFKMERVGCKEFMQVGAKPNNEHKNIQKSEAARLTGLHVYCYMRAKNEESINLATTVVLWTNNCITMYSQVRKGNQSAMQE